MIKYQEKPIIEMIERSSVFVLSDKFDSALEEILAWFKIQNTSYFHIRESNPIWVENFLFDVNSILIDFTIINLETNLKIAYSQMDGFLYRGGDLNISLEHLSINLTEVEIPEIEANLLDEITYIKRMLFKKLIKLDKVLSSPFDARPDKLEMLNLAMKSGLKIPKSAIITRKNEVNQDYLNQYIVKPLTDNVMYRKDNKKHATFTSILINNIEFASNHFFPSLIQEKINTAYELRVFFLEKTLYAARLTFENQTIDYRKEVPGFVGALPYHFSNEEEKLILTFIKLSGYITGSIDLIRDVNNQLYFLEINPNGAFEWISSECNYNISLEIAKFYQNVY